MDTTAIASVPEYRFFLAHPYASTDDELEQWPVSLAALLRTQLPNANITVTTGRDDYLNRSATEGGFGGSWARSVALGTTYGNVPRYHGIVVHPHWCVGRSTAEIIENAFRIQKPVAWWDGVGGLHPCLAILCVNPRDQKTGWELRGP